MDSFVYCWSNLTDSKVYVGYHKGAEDDGYICSSRSQEFWDDFYNPEKEWSRSIVAHGTKDECRSLESEMLHTLWQDANCYNLSNNHGGFVEGDIQKHIIAVNCDTLNIYEFKEDGSLEDQGFDSNIAYKLLSMKGLGTHNDCIFLWKPDYVAMTTAELKQHIIEKTKNRFTSSKELKIEGILYPNSVVAGEALGIKDRMVRYRVASASKRFQEWKQL